MNEGQRRTNSIIVKNLPIECNQNQLEDLFSKFGRIISSKILPQNPSFDGGCGFVNFADAESSQRAVEQMNNANVNGFHLRVLRSMGRTNGNNSDRSGNASRNNFSPSNEFSNFSSAEKFQRNFPFHREISQTQKKFNENENFSEEKINEVFLTNFEVPNVVFVATVENYLLATKLIAEMNKDKNFLVPFKSKPSIGDLCAALFNGDWYRGRVIELDENRILVQYVDWGNKNWCNIDDEIRFLPAEFHKIPTLCSKFFLENVAENFRVNEAQNVKILEIFVFDSKLEMKIVRNENDRRYVELKLNERNLNVEIVDFLSKQKKNVLTLKKSEIHQVQLTTADRNDGIFQVLLLNDSLPTIVNVLKNWEKDRKPMKTTPTKKSLVCAQYGVDGLWYRAWIEEIQEELFEVFFVDFGTRETVGSNRLAECPQILRSLPWQSVAIRFDQIDFTEDEKKFLVEKFQNENLKMKIIDFANDVYTVDLSFNEKSLKNLILQQREKKRLPNKVENEKGKSSVIQSPIEFPSTNFLIEQRRQTRILEQILAAINTNNALLAQLIQHFS